MLLYLWSLVILATCSAAQLHAQTPLAWSHGSDDTPSVLSAVSDQGHTDLSHPAFPKHGVRITRVKGFCDTTVAVYTGYVDIEARHLFFWFFESRRDPDEDDVMLWLNGGPGGSSATGLFMELGPCSIAGPNSTTYNPYSWNEFTNLIFLDQPVGTGFSYADHGETVSRTEESAVDVAAFFAILSERFPQFRGRKLHLAGESYAGRFLPLYAAAILDQNAYLEKWGMDPTNIASVIIGNGLCDFYSWYAFRYDMMCTRASGLAPVLPISTCVRMKEATKRCLSGIRTHCYDTHDEMDCHAISNFCMQELTMPLVGTGINPYDLSTKCKADPICYVESDHIIALLNSDYIRKLIRTDSQPTNFTIISETVSNAFRYDMEAVTTTAYLSGLLERGVPILIYAGTYDAAASWLDNERMTRIVEWSGQQDFVNSPMQEWEVNGVKAGEVRSSSLLTFASIYAAGHMAPHDKPVQALEMIRRWLSNEGL